MAEELTPPTGEPEKKSRRTLVDLFPDVEVGARGDAPEGLIDAAEVTARTGFNPTQISSWHKRGELTPRYIIGAVDAEGKRSGRRGMYHEDDVKALLDRPMSPNNRAKLGTVEQRQERISKEIESATPSSSLSQTSPVARMIPGTASAAEQFKILDAHYGPKIQENIGKAQESVKLGQQFNDLFGL